MGVTKSKAKSEKHNTFNREIGGKKLLPYITCIKEDGIRYIWTGECNPPVDLDKDIDPAAPAVTIIEENRVVYHDHMRFKNILKQFKALLHQERRKRANLKNKILAEQTSENEEPVEQVSADSINLSRQERDRLFRVAAEDVTGKYFPHLTEYLT